MTALLGAGRQEMQIYGNNIEGILRRIRVLESMCGCVMHYLMHDLMCAWWVVAQAVQVPVGFGFLSIGTGRYAYYSS